MHWTIRSIANQSQRNREQNAQVPWQTLNGKFSFLDRARSAEKPQPEETGNGPGVQAAPRLPAQHLSTGTMSRCRGVSGGRGEGYTDVQVAPKLHQGFLLSMSHWLGVGAVEKWT